MNYGVFLLQNQRNELCSTIDCDVKSFLCVPVCSRVTNEVLALACMVNKNGAEKYDISYT